MTETWTKVQTTQLKNLTASQISQLIENNFLSEPATLADGVLIHKAKMAQATYGAGGVVPSTGSIESATFGDSITLIQPAENEVWICDPAMLQVVNNGAAPAAITPSLSDGTTSLDFPSVTIAPGQAGFILGVDASATAIQSYNMRLTNTLYFVLISDVDQVHTYKLPITKEAI